MNELALIVFGCIVIYLGWSLTEGGGMDNKEGKEEGSRESFPELYEDASPDG